MTREAFIKKWLANPEKKYNEDFKTEMRDDLDKVITRSSTIKTKEELLIEAGIDWELFKLENEYSAKSILSAMERYSKISNN